MTKLAEWVRVEDQEVGKRKKQVSACADPEPAIERRLRVVHIHFHVRVTLARCLWFGFVHFSFGNACLAVHSRRASVHRKELGFRD